MTPVPGVATTINVVNRNSALTTTEPNERPIACRPLALAASLLGCKAADDDRARPAVHLDRARGT
jgi:hypothetical protein